MIIESLVIVGFALILDLAFGDPKNRYHPTAWIGELIAKLTPLGQNQNKKFERLGGIFVVTMPIGIVVSLLLTLDFGISLLSTDWISLIVSIVIGALLLKTTIAIKGLERYAIAVAEALEMHNLDSARDNLSMIVKRNTSNLDKNHVISGVLESVSENTVDGITGPLFYLSLIHI